MLKRAKSPRKWRANHCHFLASQFSEALIFAVITVDKAVPSSILGAITGEQIEPFLRLSLEDASLKLPSKDRAPLNTATVKHNAQFLGQLFGLMPQMQPVVEFLIVINANAGLRELTEFLIDDDFDVLERMLQAKTTLDLEVILSQLAVFERYQLIAEATLDAPYRLLFPSVLVSILVSQKLTSAVDFLA
ncbi:ATPase, partial [Shewanella xiamenensis]